MQIFSTPCYHPKSKPFIDHILSFSIEDNRIWFRNFQVNTLSWIILLFWYVNFFSWRVQSFQRKTYYFGLLSFFCLHFWRINYFSDCWRGWILARDWYGALFYALWSPIYYFIEVLTFVFWSLDWLLSCYFRTSVCFKPHKSIRRKFWWPNIVWKPALSITQWGKTLYKHVLPV